MHNVVGKVVVFYLSGCRRQIYGQTGRHGGPGAGARPNQAGVPGRPHAPWQSVTKEKS